MLPPGLAPPPRGLLTVRTNQSLHGNSGPSPQLRFMSTRRYWIWRLYSYRDVCICLLEGGRRSGGVVDGPCVASPDAFFLSSVSIPLGPVSWSWPRPLWPQMVSVSLLGQPELFLWSCQTLPGLPSPRPPCPPPHVKEPAFLPRAPHLKPCVFLVGSSS